MTVFDVEEILHQTVSGQRLDEVCDRRLPITPEDLLINGLKTPLMGDLFEIADGASVIDELNKTTIRAVRDDGVRLHPDLDVLLLEDRVQQGDQLHGHVLLA